MKPLTDAQRRALEEIERGNVRWSTPWRGTSCRFVVAVGVKTQANTIRGVVEKGLAEIGPAEDSLYRRVVLTDSGHAALQEARG